MLKNEQLRQRIRNRLKERKRSPIQAAILGGLDPHYIRDFVKDNPKKKSINPDNYPKIALGLDWTVEQLLGQPVAQPKLNPELIGIPEIDIRAGAAYAGGISSEENLQTDGGMSVSVDAVSVINWGIPQSFVREELRSRIDKVHILPIRGDSMEPALFEGDRIIINLEDTDIAQGGIFALMDDVPSLIVKQVEIVSASKPIKIRLKSRNPCYESREILLQEPVRIIGRAICRIGRITGI